jgi:hypothetical protein
METQNRSNQGKTPEEEMMGQMVAALVICSASVIGFILIALIVLWIVF